MKIIGVLLAGFAIIAILADRDHVNIERCRPKCYPHFVNANHSDENICACDTRFRRADVPL